MQVELPPVIVQLEMRKIGVSISTGDVTNNVTFPLGVEAISHVIGLTKAGSWVIGPEFEQERKSPSKFHGGVEQKWSVMECLLPGSGNWSEEIYINRTDSRKITIEFLLGLFLNLVKEKVDKEMQGTTSEVTFVIPFWLASVQRQQLKQSGCVAGFAKVGLVNENTALASDVLGIVLPDRQLINTSPSFQRILIKLTFRCIPCRLGR